MNICLEMLADLTEMPLPQNKAAMARILTFAEEGKNEDDFDFIAYIEVKILLKAKSLGFDPSTVITGAEMLQIGVMFEPCKTYDEGLAFAMSCNLSKRPIWPAVLEVYKTI